MHDPLLTTLFLCDKMIRDAIANKWGAIGLHCGYNVPGLPIVVGEIWFFLRVADAPDVVKLDGKITAPDGEVVATSSWTFDRSERSEGGPEGLEKWWEIGGRFCNVIFAAKGRYSVEISMNGALLGETPLYIS